MSYKIRDRIFHVRGGSPNTINGYNAPYRTGMSHTLDGNDITAHLSPDNPLRDFRLANAAKDDGGSHSRNGPMYPNDGMWTQYLNIDDYTNLHAGTIYPNLGKGYTPFDQYSTTEDFRVTWGKGGTFDLELKDHPHVFFSDELWGSGNPRTGIRPTLVDKLKVAWNWVDYDDPSGLMRLYLQEGDFEVVDIDIKGRNGEEKNFPKTAYIIIRVKEAALGQLTSTYDRIVTTSDFYQPVTCAKPPVYDKDPRITYTAMIEIVVIDIPTVVTELYMKADLVFDGMMKNLNLTGINMYFPSIQTASDLMAIDSKTVYPIYRIRWGTTADESKWKTSEYYLPCGDITQIFGTTVYTYAPQVNLYDREVVWSPNSSEAGIDVSADNPFLKRIISVSDALFIQIKQHRIIDLILEIRTDESLRTALQTAFTYTAFWQDGHHAQVMPISPENEGLKYIRRKDGTRFQTIEEFVTYVNGYAMSGGRYVLPMVVPFMIVPGPFEKFAQPFEITFSTAKIPEHIGLREATTITDTGFDIKAQTQVPAQQVSAPSILPKARTIRATLKNKYDRYSGPHDLEVTVIENGVERELKVGEYTVSSTTVGKSAALQITAADDAELVTTIPINSNGQRRKTGGNSS